MLPLSDLFLTAAFMLGQFGIVLIAVALGAQSLYRDANRGQTESQDSGRRFLTALPGPPRRTGTLLVRRRAHRDRLRVGKIPA